jgi:hypothetical protein
MGAVSQVTGDPRLGILSLLLLFLAGGAAFAFVRLPRA